MRRVLLAALVAASVSALASTAAQAAVTVDGNGFALGSVHAGQDCPITGPNGSNGFSGCWATQTGVGTSAGTDPTASRSVAQIGINDAGGTSLLDHSTFYQSITGNEFSLILGAGNTLSFTYTMGDGDPILHYLSIKQADGYELFYNAGGFASGTTYTFSLNNWFPNNPGISHVTVYDSAGPVPEPATWAMMLLGFGGIGMAMRRRRQANPLAQIA